MGILISRFRGKQTTIEVLEGIDKEISRLQRNRKANQDRQKKFVTSLLIYSIVAYVIAAVVFFLLYFPDTWKLRFLYSIPLLIFPFLIWGIKKLLHWYFVKRIASNDLALQELRERKKQILEDVMETETYKKAREILEKFDPTRLRKLEGNTETASTSNISVAGTPGTVIHQRTVRSVQQVRGTPMTTPRIPRPPGPRVRQPVTPYPTTPVLPPVPRSATSQPRPSAPTQPMIRGGMAPAYAPPPGPPMPRSVLPRDRGTMDRLMDYLVGDGPENRYALICRQCHSHNGMALKEEFEYLTFRCCYCFYVNPARKQRPMAPRLEFFAPPGRGKGSQTASGASNEESDDDDVDSDEEDHSDVDSKKSDASAGGPSDPRANVATKSQSPSHKPTLDQNIKGTPKPKSGIAVALTGARSAPKSETRSLESTPRSRPASTASLKQGQAEGKPALVEKPADLVKSAEVLKTVPGFDKNDFFSLPASSARVAGNSSVHNGSGTSGVDSHGHKEGNTSNNNDSRNGEAEEKRNEKQDVGRVIPRLVTDSSTSQGSGHVQPETAPKQPVVPKAGGSNDVPSTTAKESAP